MFINDECDDVLLLERIREMTDVKISNIKKSYHKE